MFAKTLTPEHQLVGIGRVRLGRALLRQQRYTEAEAESRPGYEILAKQETPPALWMQNVRNDLIEEYDALQQPDKAAKIRAELAASQNKTPATTAKN
jgi:serine/threonine-protein kinase